MLTAHAGPNAAVDPVTQPANDCAGHRRRLSCGAWLLLAVLVLLLTLAAGAWVLSTMFTEDLVSRRGSLSYFVTISRTIREIPLVERVGEPVYTSSPSDGPAPEYARVEFASRATTATLQARIEAVLAHHHYQPDRSRSGYFTGGDLYVQKIGGENWEFEVLLSAKPDGLVHVTVQESGYDESSVPQGAASGTSVRAFGVELDFPRAQDSREK